MATVVNKNAEGYDVNIGPGSKWHNPYIVSSDLSREDSINLFRAHLFRQIEAKVITLDSLLYLKGKRLGCECKPLQCHGDVLIDAIEWAEQERELASIASEYEMPANTFEEFSE